MENIESNNEQQLSDSNVTEAVTNAPIKHSGVGISSFVISMVAILLVIIAYVGMGVIIANNPEIVEDLDNPPMELILLSLLILFAMFLQLIGTALGIGGCFHKSRKKLFSVLGLVFSLIPLCFLGLMMLLGILNR